MEWNIKLFNINFDKNGFIARRIEEVPQASINNYKYSYKYSKDGNLIRNLNWWKELEDTIQCMI